MWYIKGNCFFQYCRPSGCDTSKLLSDDLKNKLYYDGFQKVLYHYSHQEKPVHIVYWFFFLSTRWKGLEQGGGAQRRKQSHSAALLSLRVQTRRNVYRGSCKSKDFMAFLFCEPWLHGFCTVFARSVFSMSDDVGRCIALQSVPFFASGEQG